MTLFARDIHETFISETFLLICLSSLSVLHFQNLAKMVFHIYLSNLIFSLVSVNHNSNRVQ